MCFCLPTSQQVLHVQCKTTLKLRVFVVDYQWLKCFFCGYNKVVTDCVKALLMLHTVPPSLFPHHFPSLSLSQTVRQIGGLLIRHY